MDRRESKGPPILSTFQILLIQILAQVHFVSPLFCKKK